MITKENLKAELSKIENLSEYVDYFFEISKPAVGIALSEGLMQDAGSRFGGHPFVPKDFEWPQHNIGTYRFLGQIRFDEINNAPPELPNRGLLSLFYAFDENGECFWGDDGYVYGYYWPDVTDFILFESNQMDVPNPIPLSFIVGLDFPRDELFREDWPFDPDLLYELAEELDLVGEYLLGYPSFNTLAYDPTPAGDWISLLTVHSLDEFDWCWHDGDKLMIFIEKSKLLAEDFSFLKSDAG